MSPEEYPNYTRNVTQQLMEAFAPASPLLRPGYSAPQVMCLREAVRFLTAAKLPPPILNPAMVELGILAEGILGAFSAQIALTPQAKDNRLWFEGRFKSPAKLDHRDFRITIYQRLREFENRHAYISTEVYTPTRDLMIACRTEPNMATKFGWKTSLYSHRSNRSNQVIPATLSEAIESARSSDLKARYKRQYIFEYTVPEVQPNPKKTKEKFYEFNDEIARMLVWCASLYEEVDPLKQNH